ncbi:hypothetical protein [Carboxylicivirga sp. M1479]|uniref:hypothetical protein n=1 Tax=Carboxylicivirga sp. M1479 TaxID=2594476 RepID=UPI001177F142|nr:hypothetical protein [Carboxylicivirga sp. M1479]TRX71498.1 hypothetical protein FNN09_05885 [Carboxylicivirga sp. M1479]
MTLLGRVFMWLFIMTISFTGGFAVGVKYTKEKIENEMNSGNKNTTEIVIEKNKNGNIIIETESTQEDTDEEDEKPKKKKWFW